MAGISLGPWTWSGERTDDNHREYPVTYLVYTDHDDNPSVAMRAAGLPTTGSIFNEGIPGVLGFAYCTPFTRARYHGQVSGEPFHFWLVDKKFSTRPLDTVRDDTYTDPTLEPDRLSGSFVKFVQEATKVPGSSPPEFYESSSHELIRGPQVEFDNNKPTVIVEKTERTFDLGGLSTFVDTVNDDVVWGLPARTLKLSSLPWTRHYQLLAGGSYQTYFVYRLEFDVDMNTFDRLVPDEGTRVLRGEWVGDVWVPDVTADKDNPQDFIRWTARPEDGGEIIPHVLLDGIGNPVQNTNLVAEIEIKHYQEQNFSLLDLPPNLTDPV